MLISAFAKAAGMSVDTIRFYVRRGLIRPEMGTKGGKNPYQIFTAQHVQAARLIRLSQGLGFSLKEIGAIADEYHRGEMTLSRSREILVGQLSRLEEKQADIDAMIVYTRAKIAWMDGGLAGPEPSLGAYGVCGATEKEETAPPLRMEQAMARSG